MANDKRVTVRVPDKLYRAIVDQSVQEGRTESDVVRRAIEMYFERSPKTIEKIADYLEILAAHARKRMDTAQSLGSSNDDL
jgi:predicted DNA-binding protein